MIRCERLLGQIHDSLPGTERTGRGLELVNHEAEATHVLLQLRTLYTMLTPIEGNTHAAESIGRTATTYFIMDDRWPPRKDSAISLMPDGESLWEERHSDLYTSSPTYGRGPSDEKEVYFQRPCRSNSSLSIDTVSSDISWCTALCGPDTPCLQSDTVDPVAHQGEPDTLCNVPIELRSDEDLADSISLRIGLYVSPHSGSGLVAATVSQACTDDVGSASGAKNEALSSEYAATKHGDLPSRRTLIGKPAPPRRPPPPVPRSAKHYGRRTHSAVTTRSMKLATGVDVVRPRMQILEQSIVTGPPNASSSMQRTSSLPPESLRPGKRPIRADSKAQIESASMSLLAEHRVQAIIHSWNRRHWDEAELLLQEHLKICGMTQDWALQHLLAVCASFRGEWQEAIARFISNFRKPLNNSENIDAGVCAAAYWLGDLYAMQNRTTDALLAYAIAEYDSVADASHTTTSQEVIRADQATMRLGISHATLKQQWQDNNTHREWPTDRSSILNPEIVSAEVAQAFFDHQMRMIHGEDCKQIQEHHPCRIDYVTGASGLSGAALLQQQALMISSETFKPSSSWPLPFDPLFSLGNVRQGRVLPFESDMLASRIFIPRANALALRKLEWRFYKDVTWLITAMRECLCTLEMGYSEVVDARGARWMCRWSSMQQRLATTRYFTIDLLRHPWRSDYYGIAICSGEGGLRSSRVLKADELGISSRGVHCKESKRVRKLIREQIELASAARRPGEQWQIVEDCNVGTVPSKTPYD